MVGLVTSNQTVGRQAVRPTNTMAIMIIVSLLFSHFTARNCTLPVLHQIKRTGEQGKVLAVIGLVIGYVSLALLIAATILIVGASRTGGKRRVEHRASACAILTTQGERWRLKPTGM